MSLLCACWPRLSASLTDKSNRSLSPPAQREDDLKGITTPTSRLTHKHGLQWRVQEILLQECESREQLHSLLNFAHTILAKRNLGSPVTRWHDDTTVLYVILDALPPEEQFRTRCRDLVQILEKGGFSMSVLDASKDTPLLRAIKTGNRGALDALLRTRCDINATDRYSSTCLIYAVQRNDMEVVKTILRLFPRSVNLDKTDYANYTALAYAASNNHLDLCALLLQAGARPDVNSTSPLFLAVSNNASLKLIQLLISKGASVNVSNSDGMNAVAAAAKNRKPEVVSLLLESGANCSFNWHKNSAFLIALNMDHLQILQIFVDHGVEVLSTNPKGYTVVHEACGQGSVRFLSYIVAITDINLDVRNRQRRTAAHFAAQYGHGACLEVLFLAGADCWSLDPRGQSALEIALFHNRSECVSFFVEHPVFPRQRLFSTLHMLRNDYDPDALSRKPAVAHFSSLLYNRWGVDNQVDSLLNTCVISIRRVLRQKPASKVLQLPLPEKMKNKILSYQ